MSNGYFITGTDTGVGKTRVACGLMAALRAHGACVNGMKPVASGCVDSADGLRNDDALALMAEACIALPYEQVNPYAFAPAIAPHIAAREVGVAIDINRLVQACAGIAEHSDVVVVEGAGGWLTPLDESRTMADLALALRLPVILVVGLRLGCLNHALLTAEAIRARGAPLAGWVANHIEADMERAADNVQTLRAALGAPCLGELPYCEADAAAVAARLTLPA